MDAPLQLLHLDEALVAVTKPAGLPVHRSAYVGSADEFLIDRLRTQVPGPLHLAHRLDRPTSGVLLVGRSAGIAAALDAQFSAGAIAKTYLAVARGWPEPAAGSIDYPVAGAHGAGPRKDARTTAPWRRSRWSSRWGAIRSSVMRCCRSSRRPGASTRSAGIWHTR